MQLGRDFTDLLECFSKHQVEFLIVGGYATSVNKRAVGRPQDLADVAAIESHPEPTFEE